MSSASPLSTRLRALAAASCLGLLAVACRDDDDTTAATDDTAAPAEGETAGADVEEYCALIAELDSQDGPPTNEQLTELKELAPEEISGDTTLVADAFIDAEGDMGKVFSDPNVEEAFGRMEDHDVEACGIEPPEDDEEELETEAAEGAQVISVTALDYEFEGIPDEIPAGPVAFELTNEGEDAHEMIIFKLGEGVDVDELLASDEEPTPEEAEEVGGTFAPPGEGGVFANVDLEPGTYAVICFIPGPEGKAHYEHGMKTTFTVA